jgi:hypothetical protein
VISWDRKFKFAHDNGSLSSNLIDTVISDSKLHLNSEDFLFEIYWGCKKKLLDNKKWNATEANHILVIYS